MSKDRVSELSSRLDESKASWVGPTKRPIQVVGLRQELQSRFSVSFRKRDKPLRGSYVRHAPRIRKSRVQATEALQLPHPLSRGLTAENEGAESPRLDELLLDNYRSISATMLERPRQRNPCNPQGCRDHASRMAGPKSFWCEPVGKAKPCMSVNRPGIGARLLDYSWQRR